MYIVTTPVINVVPINTVILNEYEQALLIQMIGSDSLTLLYRASRDGFKSSNFHANVATKRGCSQHSQSKIHSGRHR